MGRASPLLLVLLALGFFFATYNLLTLVIQYKDSSTGLRSGISDPVTGMPANSWKLGKSNLKFHVALTATDAPYSQWQCRIMYYWYKKMKTMPGSDMGKFTRVLHSGKGDHLMDEIPTFVVDPLPEGLDRVRFSVFTFAVAYIYSPAFIQLHVDFQVKIIVNLNLLWEIYMSQMFF